MQIRRYSFATLLFLVLIGWYVFAFITHNTTGDVSISETRYLPDMPYAIAVLIPAILLFIFTLLHMLFFSLVDYVKNLTQTTDFKKLEQAILMNLNNRVDDKPHYSSKQYRDIGELLNSVKISPNDFADIEMSDKNKYKELIDILVELREGKVVKLPANSSYYIKELNLWNELKENENIAESILLQKGFYSDELYTEAFAILCKHTSYLTIQRYERWFSFDALWNMLIRIDAEENSLHLEKDEILEFIDRLNFTRKNYIKFAQVIKSSSIVPDTRIEIFKTFVEKTSDALDGYIYTLLDLEMIDNAQEILNELQSDELENFKAYILIKDKNLSSIDIDYFIRE